MTARDTEPRMGVWALVVAGNDDWVDRALRINAAQAVAVVSLAIAASWAVNFVLGGAGSVPPHFFYAPILLAATRFGLAGALITAAVSGVVAGPLLPLDAALRTAQPLSDWTSRTAFFAAIGVVMALIIGRLKAVLRREVALAEAERELTRHKEAVIATVSHEFRTPLTVIRGSIEFFSEPGVVIDTARPLVDTLGLAAVRLENLVDVVLAASGTLVGGGAKEPVPIREVCEEMSPRVRFEITPGAESVACDRQMLAFVLRAVIDNALRFSPPDAHVEVDVRRVADVVEIRVRDRGPGMSDTDRSRAFEPFTQKDESTTRRLQGLGMGLFAARKTAELLGGSIELEPAPGGGTVAVVTIPPSPSHPPPPRRGEQLRL